MLKILIHTQQLLLVDLQTYCQGELAAQLFIQLIQ